MTQIKCESVIPSETWVNPITERREGECIKCGFRGLLRPGRPLLYQHHRDASVTALPELVDYNPLYMDITVRGLGLVDYCLECGALVIDTDAHDDYHQNIINDLNLLRQEKANRL